MQNQRIIFTSLQIIFLGLSLSLYIEQNEYLDRVAPAAGARIVIHDSDQKPFPGDEGFIVAAGHTTSVYLSKVSWHYF